MHDRCCSLRPTLRLFYVRAGKGDLCVILPSPGLLSMWTERSLSLNDPQRHLDLRPAHEQELTHEDVTGLRLRSQRLGALPGYRVLSSLVFLLRLCLASHHLRPSSRGLAITAAPTETPFTPCVTRCEALKPSAVNRDRGGATPWRRNVVLPFLPRPSGRGQLLTLVSDLKSPRQVTCYWLHTDETERLAPGQAQTLLRLSG